MKKILIIILAILPILGFSQLITVTFTNQADFNAYPFISDSSYFVILDNDTNLPVSQQINSLQPLSVLSLLGLSVNNTLIENSDGLENIDGVALYLEGNKNWDTLYIPNNITILSLQCERTSLKHIYGAPEVKSMGFLKLYNNDNLKTVDLDLGEMDTTGVMGLSLSVQQNDSLKTFYWNNPHRQLSKFSFFENRQLKHVHLETVKEMVTAITKSKGGFVFNPELDSISGFKGLKRARVGYISLNYMLGEVCVLQEPLQNEINLTTGIDTIFQIFSNGPTLQSLNDLLTADCSWLPNGVQELAYPELKLYPNPTHNEVFVEMPTQLTTYQIYDMSGKIVQQGTVASNGRIGLTSVSGGMYVLLVNNKRSKLVIQ